jgi:hypothetical protein
MPFPIADTKKTMPLRHLTTSLFLSLLALVLSGCGYHNPYLTQGLKPITISRSMWTNRTTELGLPTTLFQAQSDWLRKSPLITISASAAQADYELTGAIDRVSYPEISFGTFREGTEGRAELTVSFTLKETTSGKVVWERKTVTRQQAFYMSQDPIRLHDNHTAALAEIADDVAEEIYLHLITTTMRSNPAP